MSARDEINEVLELAALECDDQATPEQMTRLEELLAGSPAARRRYLHYVFLHAHLATSDESLREGAVSDVLASLTAAAAISSPAAPTAVSARAPVPRTRWSRWSAALVSGGLIAAAITLALFWNPTPQRPQNPTPIDLTAAHYSQSAPPAEVVATLTGSGDERVEWSGPAANVRAGAELEPGTLRIKSGEAKIEFHGGADVTLSGPAVLGVEQDDRGTLFAGQLSARMTRKDARFTVDTSSVRIVDLGTEFGVRIDEQGRTEVHVFEGEVETQARVRLPRFYWAFDEVEGPARDVVHGVRGEFLASASRTAGLVGRGAAAFDNTRFSAVRLGNGRGTTTGTGAFAVSTGVTIEALILPEWSGGGFSTGEKWDYDEIFRKEDGVYRLLLSFQNDDGAKQTVIPEVERGPCLSFGLHLTGSGYSELDVPLDGLDGRPTLAELKDGRPHHVAATYDSYTGRKRLYIDGVKCLEAAFPPGSLILSGGAAEAFIGNLKPHIEPFTGVIDEVAFYDYALTEKEITAHWENSQSGKNYYGIAASGELAQTVWKPTSRLKAGEAQRFDAATGLSLGPVPLDSAGFGR